MESVPNAKSPSPISATCSLDSPSRPGAVRPERLARASRTRSCGAQAERFLNRDISGDVAARGRAGHAAEFDWDLLVDLSEHAGRGAACARAVLARERRAVGALRDVAPRVEPVPDPARRHRVPQSLRRRRLDGVPYQRRLCRGSGHLGDARRERDPRGATTTRPRSSRSSESTERRKGASAWRLIEDNQDNGRSTRSSRGIGDGVARGIPRGRICRARRSTESARMRRGAPASRPRPQRRRPSTQPAQAEAPPRTRNGATVPARARRRRTPPPATMRGRDRRRGRRRSSTGSERSRREIAGHLTDHDRFDDDARAPHSRARGRSGRDGDRRVPAQQHQARPALHRASRSRRPDLIGAPPNPISQAASPVHARSAREPLDRVRPGGSTTVTVAVEDSCPRRCRACIAPSSCARFASRPTIATEADEGPVGAWALIELDVRCPRILVAA